MGPPPVTNRPISNASRHSLSGGPVKPVLTRPSSIQPRQLLAGSRMSLAAKPVPSNEKAELAPVPSDEESSPPLQQASISKSLGAAEKNVALERFESERRNDSASISRQPSSSTLRDGPVSSSEDRSRHAQVIKALETKVRTLQKQRQEDQAQIQNTQDLQSKNTRYEGIIQALQKKLKTNQQEMLDLKAKYEEAQSHSQNLPDRSAEQESELELATLDKEMAEERADLFQAELEALKLKHEELELEYEILREENRELASVMSPEEKTSAGWLQMERETERLRQALVMLRDMSQQNEGDLKNEIKELQESLDELEQTTSKYDDVAAKLSRLEGTNQHLREQLEAAEVSDDILETMGAERDQGRNVIEFLKRQVQELEEHIQVTDELEAFHVEEEKRLHHQLDESDAILNDKQRQNAEQEKTVEDLEYTLTKFRDVVQGLQNDINELRRTRDISELEAHEMNSKSRAMMDLNLKLQNSAAKTQLKAIDLELGKMRAEQANLHLEIVQSFVPDSFDVDKKPVLALLSFMRIRWKAQLSKSILGDRLRDRPDALQDDPMPIFAVVERMTFIANLSDRFVQYLSSCSTENFMKYAGAPFELEPIENAVTGWVEALRRDELGHEGPEHLHRMADILVDMAEKLLSDSHETKAMELLTSVSTIESFTDVIAAQSQYLNKAAQSNMGPAQDEDEESVTFGKRMDQIGIKARTIKYISGKLLHAVGDLRARSMCLGESIWPLFEDAERCAEAAAQASQRMGETVMEEFNRIDRDEPLSYTGLVDLMTTVARSTNPAGALGTDNAFDILAKQLQSLQAKIDDLNTKTADISSSIEFEKSPAPWTVRAREVKAQKILSQDLQEEMARLKSRIQEQTIIIGEKEKQLEEQQVKVELLESRAKETKMKDDGVKAMKEEIEKLRAEHATTAENLRRLEGEYQEVVVSRDTQKRELETIKQGDLSVGQGLALGTADDSTLLHFKAETDLLKGELASLQACVRFLKAENLKLRIPSGQVGMEAVEHAWLDPSHLQMGSRIDHGQDLRVESKEAFAGLIGMAKAAKPVKLKARSAHSLSGGGSHSSWQAESTTTLYQVLQRKEELEKWNELKDDLVQRARVMLRASRPKTTVRHPKATDTILPGEHLRHMPAKVPVDEDTVGFGTAVDGVHIVRH